MSKPKNNYIECINVLLGLKKSHPSFTLGQHIDTATSEYINVWGVTDKEFLFALKKYVAELEFDLESSDDIDAIIANSSNEKLFENLDEEDDGND